MRTTLNLLTRSGVVYMDFQPALSADQYAKLLEIAKEGDTADELRIVVREWADGEGLETEFDEMTRVTTSSSPSRP
jgi:hypothetical protein